MNGEDPKEYEKTEIRLTKIEIVLNEIKKDFENHLKEHDKLSNRLFVLSMTLLAGFISLVGVVIVILK